MWSRSQPEVAMAGTVIRQLRGDLSLAYQAFGDGPQ